MASEERLKSVRHDKYSMNIHYDADSDILYLDKGGKIKMSISIGNAILDVSEKYQVVALEILHASKELNIPKELLKKIIYAEIKTIQKRDSFGVSYKIFHPKTKEILDKATIGIAIPS